MPSSFPRWPVSPIKYNYLFLSANKDAFASSRSRCSARRAVSDAFPPMLSIPGYCSPRKQAFDRGRHLEQLAIMPIACNEHQSNRQPARARQGK